MPTANVVCMKWGMRYGPDYVNRLHGMVRRHLHMPFRFVCFTDDPSGVDSAVECQPIPPIEIPEYYQVSPWRKLTLFTRDLGGLTGKTLFLDLDVVITDSIDPLLQFSEKMCMPENWTQCGAGIGNSSVLVFTINAFNFVLDRYNATKETLFREYPNEQSFLSRTVGPERLAFFPKDWIVSFKGHCLPPGPLCWLQTPRLPPGARIVAFHGNPKPPDAVAGRYPGKWYMHVKPTPWVAEHWR